MIVKESKVPAGAATFSGDAGLDVDALKRQAAETTEYEAAMAAGRRILRKRHAVLAELAK